MTVERGTLAGAGDAPEVGEAARRISGAEGFEIEQILSGELPQPQAYDQDHDEWFLVLDGGAELEAGGDLHVLRAGDWMLIPAHTPHRLLSAQAGTRWLVVRGRPRTR